MSKKDFKTWLSNRQASQNMSGGVDWKPTAQDELDMKRLLESYKNILKKDKIIE